MEQRLPVEAVLDDVVAALCARRACVLVAPTGAGKTTRLPPALLDAGLGPVIVLEPRRLAARAAARRVARERGVTLGVEVGYQVRFDHRVGARTAVRFVTPGVFVRRLQDDPFLEGVGCVVLDEFHERGLEVDLALALVRRVMLDARPDLHLVVTSATLDAEAVARFLDDAPVVRSEGRLFPVEVEHLPALPAEGEAEHVARGVRRALDASEGDALVFLPGIGEIRRARTALADVARSRGLELLELYGDLDADAQDAVLEPSTRRKVVLATNVAESSVTVPGVTAVVDTGLARTLRHDPAVGLDRLVRGPISLASADQRKGRAGRERPGLCVRLWSAAEHRALPAFEEPELRRADLTAVYLQLLAWGEADPAAFPWLEPPRPEALAHARELARALGAVDARGLTDVGRVLVRVPAQPRLARLLVAGHAAGVLRRAALAAAVLGERDPWRRDVPPRPTDSDVLERVRALEAAAARGPGAAPGLRRDGVRACLRAAEQLERSAREALGAQATGSPDADDALLRALLAAFPDRLARRRPDDPARAVLVGGRGARLSSRSGVTEGELFLALELDGGRKGVHADALVHQASVVERAWVDGGATHVERVSTFDAERERVVGRKRVLLGPLVLEEVEAPAEDQAEVERVLVEAARADLARALDLGQDELTGLRARIACLAEWAPELELPVLDDAAVAELLPQLAAGCRSFADLRKAPLAGLLAAQLTPQQAAALERDAPERLTVPSGSRLRLHYEPGRPPVLAARIQELFGLRATPRVAGGRVPVLLHLLAPNGRPQQVTDDLESFWTRTYFDVRKELRRRYPKHDWPDDPTTAVARSRPRRRPPGGR